MAVSSCLVGLALILYTGVSVSGRVCKSGPVCTSSRDCGEGQCCKDAQKRTLVKQTEGPLIDVLVPTKGTCVTETAGPDQLCNENGPCVCSKGYRCYRPMSGVCCLPYRCYTEEFVKADIQRFKCGVLPARRKRSVDPNVALIDIICPPPGAPAPSGRQEDGTSGLGGGVSPGAAAVP